MELPLLKLNRFLGKDYSQNDDTKGSAYAGANPSPKLGDPQRWRKIGKVQGSEEDGGAPNILTGTVITACLIQTSGLPSRIELEGNDLTFFDDTYTQNGRVIGDTSRIVFTHDLDSGEGFIMEKRASVFNTYDNVLSWYATPAKSGSHNYMFIGRNGYANDQERNVGAIRFAVNEDTKGSYETSGQGVLNGIYAFEHSINGVQPLGYVSFAAGNTRVLTSNVFSGGFSSYMAGGDGGVTGMAYMRAADGAPLLLLYITGETAITLGADLIPDTNNAYDIGSSTMQIGNLYVHKINLGNGLTWSFGTGSPQGAVTAPIGSLYSNISGGASTTLYVKTSGAGNTGWTAK